MEYFNELLIVSTLYCMICFTDFVPIVEMQVNIGWVCCLIVSLHLAFNMFIIMKSNISQLLLRIKRLKKSWIYEENEIDGCK